MKKTKKSITAFFLLYIRSFTQYRFRNNSNNSNNNNKDNRCNGKKKVLDMCAQKHRKRKEKKGTKMGHHTAKKRKTGVKKLHAK
jgi:hypothetical protein